MAKSNKAAPMLILTVFVLLIVILAYVLTGTNSNSGTSHNNTNKTNQHNTTIKNASSVRILFVEPEYTLNRSYANLSGKAIVFIVTLQNIGNTPIYLTNGCDQAITVSIIPNSSANFTPNGAGACAIGSPLRLNQTTSTNYTVPAFVNLIINKPGRVTANFNLTWYTSIHTNTDGGSFPNSTPAYMTFSRNFTFG